MAREFWISDSISSSPTVIPLPVQKGVTIMGGIYVREVDPNEPDYKKLAQELAEALENIEKHQGHAVGSYTFGWREISRHAIAKYPKALEGK